MGAEEAIRETLDSLATAWNRQEVELFASLFTDDADYVSGTGLWLRGRKAIEQGISGGRAMTGEQSNVMITGTWIKFLRTDVALVHNTWKMGGSTDQKQGEFSSRHGILTQVLICEGKRWRIAALQNTDVEASL